MAVVLNAQTISMRFVVLDKTHPLGQGASLAIENTNAVHGKVLEKDDIKELLKNPILP